MKILVTGAAGFIGFHTCLKLVSQGHEVYGVDNINNYYDPKLKFDRLNELGFNETETKVFNNEVQSVKFSSLRFSRLDLVDGEGINNLFKQEQISISISNSYLLLMFAGLLVGIGTRVSGGCTSGHGISGIGRFSVRSIIATITFMIVGIITVYLKNIL